MNVVFDPSLILKFWRHQALPEGGRHVLIACMPKSGSTWLRRLVQNLPGMRSIDAVPGWDHREQELATDLLALWHRSDWVTQNHIRWSSTTDHMLEAFAIKPVVLVRNMFDVVPSVADHFRKEGVMGPTAFVDPEMAKASDEASWPFIVDMVVPWYFNFFMTWQNAKRPVLWLRYEDLQQDPRGTLQKVVDFCELDAPAEVIDRTIEAVGAKNTRLNKGVTGRGDALPEELKARIRRYADYYPGTDFSLVGL